MSASDTYVLADTYQEALKMAYVLAEQRYWSWDNSKELFGIIVSKVDEKFWTAPFLYLVNIVLVTSQNPLYSIFFSKTYKFT